MLRFSSICSRSSFISTYDIERGVLRRISPLNTSSFRRDFSASERVARSLCMCSSSSCICETRRALPLSICLFLSSSSDSFANSTAFCIRRLYFERSLGLSPARQAYVAPSASSHADPQDARVRFHTSATSNRFDSSPKAISASAPLLAPIAPRDPAYFSLVTVTTTNQLP